MQTVHNDFHQTHSIFQLFNDLKIADIEKQQHIVNDPALQPSTNGVMDHEPSYNTESSRFKN
jgi:hypothetical protein